MTLLIPAGTKVLQLVFGEAAAEGSHIQEHDMKFVEEDGRVELGVFAIGKSLGYASLNHQRSTFTPISLS